MKPSPLILAYDAECSHCCKRADWIRQRDHGGLITLFPLQHPDLAIIAPELAGRALHGELHGLELKTRTIWQGPDLLPEILDRLPRWCYVAPLLRWPGVAKLIARWALRRAERSFQRGLR